MQSAQPPHTPFLHHLSDHTGFIIHEDVEPDCKWSPVWVEQEKTRASGHGARPFLSPGASAQAQVSDIYTRVNLELPLLITSVYVWDWNGSNKVPSHSNNSNVMTNYPTTSPEVPWISGGWINYLWTTHSCSWSLLTGAQQRQLTRAPSGFSKLVSDVCVSKWGNTGASVREII